MISEGHIAKQSRVKTDSPRISRCKSAEACTRIMKHYVQYHNAFKQGRLEVDPQVGFLIFAKKPLKHLIGQRIWLISGHGKTSPKQYQLEYTFVADEVITGAPNRAIGKSGVRFAPAPVLNHQPWFPEFLKQQANFSLGASPVPEEFIAELEAIAKGCRSLLSV